jgi:hypothetical protein
MALQFAFKGYFPLFGDGYILFPDTPNNIIRGLTKNTLGGWSPVTGLLQMY